MPAMSTPIGRAILGGKGNSTGAVFLDAPSLSPTGDGGFTVDPGATPFQAVDVLTAQTQLTGGDWSGATSSPHTISPTEVTSQFVDWALSLAPGVYDVRVFLSRGLVSSGLSNTIQVTIASANGDIVWNGNDITWNGNEIIWA